MTSRMRSGLVKVTSAIFGTGIPWAASIVLLSGSLTQQGEL
jgi:hypothetical protein